MHQVIQYIKFLFKSTNQHGVHSPFVFDLVTKCFYDTTNYPDYEKLKSYRQSLLRNDSLVSVTDLGSGSKRTTSNTRQICAIAKTSGTTYKRAKLLYRLSHYFKFKSILELGTSVGIATHALHLGNPNATLTSIEGCPNLALLSKTRFTNQPNITIISGAFDEQIPLLKAPNYDCIFFDGNHTKDATLHYFEALLPKATNDTVFIFDDIYWSKGMTEAWETIKQHPKVTVTVDTFFWGFVFFRKEQAKEHFTIRL